MTLRFDPTEGKEQERIIKIKRDEVDEHGWKYLGMLEGVPGVVFFRKGEKVMRWSCLDRAGVIFK